MGGIFNGNGGGGQPPAPPSSKPEYGPGTFYGNGMPGVTGDENGYGISVSGGGGGGGGGNNWGGAPMGYPGAPGYVPGSPNDGYVDPPGGGHGGSFYPTMDPGPSAEELEAQRQRDSDYLTIDDLWSGRGSAATDAITAVDGEIKQEENQARLTGQDYAITDEERQSRINNKFATYWSETDESTLSGLADQYGNPEQDQDLRDQIYKGETTYDYEYDIVRGTPESGSSTNDSAKTEASGSSKARVKTPAKKKANLLGTSEEKEILLGK